jgi:YVTN family beta-propeller protein
VLKGIRNLLAAKGLSVPVDLDQLGGPATMPNLYQAPSVNVLTSGLSWKPWKWKSDLNQLFNVNLPKYLTDEQVGEMELYEYLTNTYQDCLPTGQEPMVVLAGYSQGAMVVHNVLNLLITNGETGPARMIKGSALIADPERVAFSDVVNFGTAPAPDKGICAEAERLAGTSLCTAGASTPDVTNVFATSAVALCDNNDTACDTSADLASNATTDIQDIFHGIWVHTNCHSYCGSEVVTAGKSIGRRLIKDGLGATPSTVYVANAASGTVTPISTATNTAEQPIKVGTGPNAIAITPNGATAYVLNSGSGTVTPINTTTNTAGSAISVGQVGGQCHVEELVRRGGICGRW